MILGQSSRSVYWYQHRIDHVASIAFVAALATLECSTDKAVAVESSIAASGTGLFVAKLMRTMAAEFEIEG